MMKKKEYGFSPAQSKNHALAEEVGPFAIEVGMELASAQ